MGLGLKGFMIAMVGSDGTHNFISSKKAQHACLQPTNYFEMNVMVASGERVASLEKFSRCFKSYESYNFRWIFSFFPFEGDDIVIGTQWLRSLQLI